MEKTGAPTITIFSKYLPDTPSVQLVSKLDRGKSYESGTKIVRAAPWLAELDLKSLQPSHSTFNKERVRALRK
jgi:hypothetical protein